MNRKRAVRNIVAVAILTIISVLAAVMSFEIPFNHYNYNGYIGGINKGYDFGNGVTGYFSATPTKEGDINFDKNLIKLEKEFTDFLDSISIQYTLNKTSEGFKVKSADINNIYGALKNIKSKGEIGFKAEDSATAESKVVASDIDEIKYANNAGTHGILIVFTKDGAKKFEDFTSEQVGNNIYLFVGETKFSENSVSEALSGGVVFLSTSSNIKADAFSSALKLNASLMGIDINPENVLQVEPLINNVSAYIIIAVLALLIFKVLFTLIKKYKQLGWLLSMMILLELSVLMLIYALVPNALMSLATLSGFIFGFGIIIANTYLLINNLKSEFETGKKFTVSTRFAFKNILWTVLSANGTVFIATIFMLIFGTGIVKLVAIPVAIASLLSVIFTLLLNRVMINTYLYTNTKNYDKLGFTKVEVLNDNE